VADPDPPSGFDRFYQPVVGGPVYDLQYVLHWTDDLDDATKVRVRFTYQEQDGGLLAFDRTSFESAYQAYQIAILP